MHFLCNKIRSPVLQAFRNITYRYRNYHTKHDVFGHKAETVKTPLKGIYESPTNQREGFGGVAL